MLDAAHAEAAPADFTNADPVDPRPLNELAPLPELRPDAWASVFDYQREGIARAVTRRNFSLWAACGSGKTYMALAWIVAERGPAVVFTRSGARDQWAYDEIPRFLLPSEEGGPEPYVLLPQAERDRDHEPIEEYLRRVRRPLVIAGWSALQATATRKELDRVFALRPSVVWDEAHTAKAYQHTRRRPNADGTSSYTRLDTVAAHAATYALRARRRLALTATPIPDRRRDLWAQLNLVEPGSVGRSPWPWFMEFCGAYRGEHGMITDGSSNDAKLLTLLAPRSHVVTAETVWRGLPPCDRLLTTVPRAEQDPEDPAARADLFKALKEMGGRRGDHDALRQAGFAAASSRKRSAIVRRAHDVLVRDVYADRRPAGMPPKMLIFTGTRRETEALGRLVAAPQANVYVADGSTPPRERERIRRAYMEDDSAPACIIGTGAAWGESMNLQRTDYQIIAALPWTWGQIRQWEGRARRKRQDRPLTVEYLFAEGTCDVRMFPLVRRKLLDAAALLPDAQIDDVRTVLAGGSDEELIDAMIDEWIDDGGGR